MKLACICCITLAMSLPPAGRAHAQRTLSRQGVETPAQESRTPRTVIGSKEERVGKAANLYDSGRFVEAALEFEGLVKDYPREPNFLFNAAVSRYGAGHYGHAVAYTREYLASGELSPEDRQEAEAQLAEALRKSASVRVAVRAPGGGSGDATVVAQHVARASSDLRPELLFPVSLSGGAATVELELDPGAWTLRVEGPGYVRQEQQLELTQGTPGAVEFSLALAPDDPQPVPTPPDVTSPLPAREVPADIVRKSMLGLGIAGGIVVLGGVAVSTVGGVKVGKHLKGFECNAMGGADPYATCRRDWRAPYRTRDLGLATLGGGIGLVAGGLTWMVRDPRSRQAAFLAETVVGGVMAIGAFVSLYGSTKRFTRLNEAKDWETTHAQIGRDPLPSISLTAFGLGLGLLTSAAVGLGVHRKHAGWLRAGALTGPGQAGVLLSGDF